MKRFDAGRLSLAGLILCVSAPAWAAPPELSQIPPIADVVCGDVAMLKWALSAVAVPVIASILANLRNRLPPAVVAIIDAVALNFVKAGRTTPPAIAAAALLFLTGCTASQQATVSGFEASALKGAQSAEDNNILIWKTDACGTPFSAVVRNAQTVPGLVPALSALCVPNADKGNPADLLNSAPSAAP
ncbi:MAG TPA: hypothetical protein VKZ79_03625 [Alphaproteobacteria bacterium]|nr:hypothetical protein [Alphaproteobacteria bacterium]